MKFSVVSFCRSKVNIEVCCFCCSSSVVQTQSFLVFDGSYHSFQIFTYYFSKCLHIPVRIILIALQYKYHNQGCQLGQIHCESLTMKTVLMLSSHTYFLSCSVTDVISVSMSFCEFKCLLKCRFYHFNTKDT